MSLRSLFLISAILILISSCGQVSTPPADNQASAPKYPMEITAVAKRGTEKISEKIFFDFAYFKNESQIMQLPDRAQINTGKNIVLLFQNTKVDPSFDLLIELKEIQLNKTMDISNSNIKISYRGKDFLYPISTPKEGHIFITEKSGEFLKGSLNLSLLADSYRGKNIKDLSMQMSGEFEVKLVK